MCNDILHVHRCAMCEKGREVVDRREQRRLETRQSLLDAAEHVFSQKGYQEASVLDITEAADVSKRTFYLHFTDKEDIIEALAMRELETLRARIEAAEATEAAPDEVFGEGFRRTTRMIFEYAGANPNIMQIIFGHDGSFRLQAMTREFMVRGFEENMRRKCLCKPEAPVPLELLANAVAGVIHQLLCWWFRHPNDYSPDDMAAMCVSVLFDSIQTNFDKGPEVPMGQQGAPMEVTG